MFTENTDSGQRRSISVYQHISEISFYSPNIEQGGEGGDVEGQLGVPPVEHILGHHSNQQDPWMVTIIMMSMTMRMMMMVVVV